VNLGSCIINHRNEAARAKIFLPGFCDVDGKALCNGKRLIAIFHRLAGWVDQPIPIHQIEVKLTRTANHLAPLS
jgi:hypothetical protein